MYIYILYLLNISYRIYFVVHSDCSKSWTCENCFSVEFSNKNIYKSRSKSDLQTGGVAKSHGDDFDNNLPVSSFCIETALTLYNYVENSLYYNHQSFSYSVWGSFQEISVTLTVICLPV